MRIQQQQKSDNMSTDTIVTLHSVHDYLKLHDLKVHEVAMTKDIMASCRQARQKYFDNQQSKAEKAAEKTEKVEARSKVNEDIEIVNTEIRKTLSVIENLKKSSDEIGFLAEKRTVIGQCFDMGSFLILSLI